MLWYQAGLRADPPADATISQASSPSGNQATGVSRRWPVFLPIVVRNKTSIPMNLYPLRRCWLLIHCPTHLETRPDDRGARAPRVPAGVSKLTRRLLPNDVPLGTRRGLTQPQNHEAR